MMEHIKKHPYLSSFLLTLLIGLPVGLLLWGTPYYGMEWLAFPVIVMFTSIFFIYPFVLTGLNLFFLAVPQKKGRGRNAERVFEILTILLGSLYSMLVQVLYDIQYQADWTQTLVNDQVHTPIWTQAYPTVIALSAVGVMGYLLLSLLPLSKTPPLLIVLSISAMYLGVMECILWIAQILGAGYLLLCLFPANCVLITAKTIRNKILEYKIEKERRAEDLGRNDTCPTPAGTCGPQTRKARFLHFLERCLTNAAAWPILAFLLMWPLLGICIGLLVLFGQEPDAFIKAWTQTSDWNLSTQVAPQNVYYDEHYLCTVAAGGHRKIVKPLRMGVRHGHRVIVNRQLCVANAFEQILEERTPILHRHIRHFYDTYGFPIAKLIRSPYAADAVYFLMKPLEYLFLIVIYSCDVHPEDRIAVQYMSFL